MAMNHRLRHNGWLPADPMVQDYFFRDLLDCSIASFKSRSAHVPSVETFKKAIQVNSKMVRLFEALDDFPIGLVLTGSHPLFVQATPDNQVKDFESFLFCLDKIVTAPPKFVITRNQVTEPIGVPMSLLFDILNNTSVAYDLFRMDEFNEALRQLLVSWGDYLRTGDSARTLTNEPDGWFSRVGLASLEENRGIFNETYIVPDATAVNRGYKSWDAFFTRQIRPEARPIPPEPLANSVIYNPCESTVEQFRFNVQAHDKFWLKGIGYSLYDIFDGDEALARQFVGGTVYQAFLSPQDYHRWHSPVAGTVVGTLIIPGTYYAALPDNGDERTGDPRGALIRCQPWLTVAATRAVITIRPQDEKIGLIAFVPVGMGEVSSCDVTVNCGDEIKPGQEIGMFHFGGSSYVLIVGPQARMTFANTVRPGAHLWVNTILAGVNE